MTSGRILITGGAGMIGSNLVKRLVRDGHDVGVVDNLWRGRLENLLDDDGAPLIDLDRQFYRRDLAVPGALDDLLDGVDVVFHLADVVAGIGYVFKHEREIFRQNVLINSNVVDSVARRRPRGYIYVGTACSFPRALQSGVDARPLVESDQYPADPESAYGWSKLMGEYEAQLFARECGVPTATLILHNVYGTPCDIDERRAQVIPSLIVRALRSQGEPLVVWGSGEQGRAFVHVADVVEALVAAMAAGLGAGPLQIGPAVCTSIRELAEAVVAISGKDIPVVFDRSKPEGDRGRCADYGRARAVLGWEPRVALREGLARQYRWIEQRLEEQAAQPSVTAAD